LVEFNGYKDDQKQYEHHYGKISESQSFEDRKFHDDIKIGKLSEE